MILSTARHLFQIKSKEILALLKYKVYLLSFDVYSHYFGCTIFIVEGAEHQVTFYDFTVCHIASFEEDFISYLDITLCCDHSNE